MRRQLPCSVILFMILNFRQVHCYRKAYRSILNRSITSQRHFNALHYILPLPAGDIPFILPLNHHGQHYGWGLGRGAVAETVDHS